MILQDLRYAMRMLRGIPVSPTPCSLALCVGSNAAVFSPVHAVLLLGLSFPQPGPAGGARNV
jgi:hypothetical protein